MNTAGEDARAFKGVVIGAALRECVAGLGGEAMAVMEHWELKERDMYALKRKVNANF